MLFALVDCNNFYVSCERAFNPRLKNKPVVVLSNNDGCVISRSNEAKKLKIPMGAPFYQWEFFCKQHHVQVFSSNYELYGDMSQRVMSILKEFTDDIEIYSIDEAFLSLRDDISFAALLKIRQAVISATGIPISIGLAQTKTLAKLANQMAKNNSDSGIFMFSDLQRHHLYQFPVEKIWGVGYRLAEKLRKLNIDTAGKLCDADPSMIRLHFSVTLEKTVRELNGMPCLAVEKIQPRKQIVSSRSFGKVVTQLADLEEAVSHYVTIAAKKLRKQKSVASALYVFLQTPFQGDQPRYGNSMTHTFPSPTADARYLIQAAKKCLYSIYKKEYRYQKAGVILLEISQANRQQCDMFAAGSDKSERVMKAMDEINIVFGKNAIFLAAEGVQRAWMLKCNRRSSRYTTCWGELLVVYCW